MVEFFWSFATQQEIGVNFKLMNCYFGIVIVLYLHRFAEWISDISGYPWIPRQFWQATMLKQMVNVSSAELEGWSEQVERLQIRKQEWRVGVEGAGGNWNSLRKRHLKM